MKRYEKEIKFKIKNEKEIQNKLKKIPIKRKKEVIQEDIYFDFPSKKLFALDKTLRIRKENSEIYLTYKGKRKKEKYKIREEITVKILNYKDLIEILKKIGLKPIFKIIKKRKIYFLKDYQLSIDEVKGLGKYLEIEVTTSKKNTNQILKEICDLLGVSLRNVIKKTYPEMLLKKELIKK